MFETDPTGDSELRSLRNSPDFMSLYKSGRDALRKCGLINFLRIFSSPVCNDGGANIYKAAYSAAFSEGYNKCLSDILYFEEKYMTQNVGSKPVIADYGARKLALDKGHLTKQELEKHGK